jgi:uncharacterized protein YqjF (DUF2071 family)
MPRRFLSACWQNLVMLNWEIEPAILRPLVPRGVELDFWDGRCFVSVVGFLFRGARIMGLPIPFHRNFEEVNLRFYVRRESVQGRRRGVVFIKEVVPRAAIALVARWVYNERYIACPMRSEVSLPDPTRGTSGQVAYYWNGPTGCHAVRAEMGGCPARPAPDSEEEFITEHYWGYVGQRNGSTLEYQVEHPPWRVWKATAARLQCDVGGFYGAEFEAALNKAPCSAFVAAGSAVAVYRGREL